MKNLLTLSLLLLAIHVSHAQAGSQEPPYRQFPSVPPFKLLLADSATFYSKEDLPSKKAVLVMFFSPECDHCRHQTDSIIAHIREFKDVQIVMATVLPFDRLRSFHQEYQLEKYPNIVAGRDNQFLIPGFFKAHSLPVLGFYDKKKKLIEVVEGSLPVHEILAKFDK